jgi:hypothetical protein
VDFTDEGAIGLHGGPSVAAGLGHFVVAIPVELDRIVAAAPENAPVTQPKANSPRVGSNRM